MVAHSLSNIVSQARVVSSVNAASIAILVFDSFLTFDLEVSAIWSRKWTFARVLYVFTRYSGFVEAGISIYAGLLPPGKQKCFFMLQLDPCLIALGMGAGEMIMSLRTWAAWNKDRRLTYTLPVFYFSIWFGSLVAVGTFVRSIKFDLVRSPYIGCYVTQYVSLTFAWALLLLFDAVMFILMAIPAWKAYRFQGGTRLVEVVYRDGVVYYLYLFVLSTINILITLTFPTGLGSVMVLFSRIIHAILACRVVLHIHECEHALQYASQYSIAFREDQMIS